MAVENLTATARSALALEDTLQVSARPGLQAVVSTVEVTAAASDTSTYWLARIPTTARILGASKVYWDDLASTGSPTIDLGLYAVDANVTSDVDALNDGLDVASAAGSASVVKNIADYGKRAWEYVNGVTADPGGFLDLKAVIDDADTNTGGTITLELLIVNE